MQISFNAIQYRKAVTGFFKFTSKFIKIFWDVYKSDLYEKYQAFILYLLVDVNGSKVIVLNMPWHPFIQDVI